MNTSQLKSFAQQSRKALMDTVSGKLDYVLDENSLARRESASAVSALEGLIKEIGKEQVIEKVAYTWFNRFCALRYMDVNRYNKIGIVSPVEGQTQPEILAEAKMNYIDDSIVPADKIADIRSLLNGTKTSKDPQGEAYKLLFVSYCNSLNKQLPFMFEKISDYTELLLPDDLLAQNSVLSNTIKVLDAETCKDIEVIGWLYQYYISEKKDEVFADLKKGKKISKENVPAATQIFTPKWIVSYMVENSVGKLWLESHPNNKLQSQFKYYLESAEQEEDVKAKLEELKNKDLKPQDIKVLDPACGSGHILVTAFSVLFEIYKSIGYQENEIPEMILKNNLYGLDICDRAAQLSQFAVMMKAREYDRNIFNKVKDLHICSIKDTDWIDVWVEKELLQGVKDEKYAKEQIDLLKNTFRDAKEYGSILDVKGIDFDFWEERLTFIRNLAQQQNNTPKIKGRLPYTLKQARIMQQQYECVIANPPYMGNKGMSPKLSEYVKKKYPMSKGDMFAVFKEVILNHTKQNYYSATVNQHSWMFLSSYESLREHLLNNASIDTMLHLGTRAFEELAGEVVQTTTYITRKVKFPEYIGRFVKLTEYPNAKLKEEKYLEFNQGDIYYCKQNGFHSIPGSPIAYWVSDKIRTIFKLEPSIGTKIEAKQGLGTGQDNLFFRLFWEINFDKIAFNYTNIKKVWDDKKDYIPLNKGGSTRKWYGNRDYVIKYNITNRNLLKTIGNHLPSENKYLLESISWSDITSPNTMNTFRWYNIGFIFSNTGHCAFPQNILIRNLILAYVNNKFVNNMTKILNPTQHFHIGYFNELPYPSKLEPKTVILSQFVEQNIQISKDDWDSFETSWDFEQHPLLRFSNRNKGLVDYKNIHKVEPITAGDKVQDCFNKWKEYKQEQFNKLKANEEELNRLFIEIYGLQDEMTPEVDDKDITVALADEKREIKSLLSYAVGCMLGRYSLDKKGLVFAGGEFNKDNYKTFKADDDAIIPILSEHYFSDDITERFKKFIKIAFGDKYYEENLEYIASVLGKKNNETADDTIRNYFLKDFYNDHVKRYQKRPIYWMFSSPKGNFNALVYMHRYNKDTASVILNSYLRNYRDEKLKAQIENCKQIELSASTSQGDKIKASKRREELEKIVKEVTDYERDILYPLATERKEIDLDDGVKVNYLKFGKALKDFGLKAKK